MPSYAGPSATRDDIAGTLRLLVFLGLAIGLMVADSRMGWLRAIRAQGEAAAQPLWRLAGVPAKVGQGLRDEAAMRSQLSEENRNLRNALLINRARLTRLQTAAIENARLRGLLGAAEQGGLDVQLAPILDIALDPTRQRLVLDIGADRGVVEGQAVIDAGGLVGQVIEVHAATSVVLLLTDPDHAVPVAVARNGIRLVAYGRGDRLELANVPLNSDLKVGDIVVTSGLGRRFPPGFPVGTVASLQPNESRTFLVGTLKPAAQLERGRDVLLLKRVRRPLSAQGRELGIGNRESGQSQESGIGSRESGQSQESGIGSRESQERPQSQSQLKSKPQLPQASGATSPASRTPASGAGAKPANASDSRSPATDSRPLERQP